MRPLFFNLSGWEILILFLLLLLLFGGKKIPELMKGLGKGIRSFKDGLNDMNDEIEGKSDSDRSEEKKQ